MMKGGSGFVPLFGTKFGVTITTLWFRIGKETSVAFRSAKERYFRGAKGDYATVIDSPTLRCAPRNVAYPPLVDTDQHGHPLPPPAWFRR